MKIKQFNNYGELIQIEVKKNELEAEIEIARDELNEHYFLKGKGGIDGQFYNELQFNLHNLINAQRK